MLIAGDIGGTKTNLALFDESKGSGKYFQFESFHSKDYKGFEEILKAYLSDCKKAGYEGPFRAACFAIAGPVKEGVCKATNLPWVVDAHALSQALKISQVYLINDLEANAWAIEILSAESLMTLYSGQGSLRGNRAVVSPGTGLGEAGLFWDGHRHHPFACEGGHCEFGPCNLLEVELSSYLIHRFGHASYERVLSGPGLHNIYRFYVESKGRSEPEWLVNEMKTKDPAAVISENALNGRSPLCEETLNLFVNIFGSEAGNCALKFMAFGGVFLGGGIPPKILPKLKEPFFLKGFIDKGRLQSLLETIPIYIVLDDKASLRGAAHYCRSH